MKHERREAERFRLAFPVLVEGPFGLRRCIARDVSARGVLVETSERMPVGTEARVIFAVPDGSWEMAIRCTVRRVVRIDASDGALHALGLSFEEIEEDLGESVSIARRHHA